MRKLKKSVRNTILLGVGLVFVGGFVNNQIKFDNYEAYAEYEKVDEKKYVPLTYMEKLDLNHAEVQRREYDDKVKAFFLYEKEGYYIFMENDSHEKKYVDTAVIEKSYAEDIQIGDNVTLYGGMDVDFVGIEAGKSIGMIELSVENISADNTQIVYEDKNGKNYNVNKDLIDIYNLKNSDIGSVATGYTFNEELVAVTKGW